MSNRNELARAVGLHCPQAGSATVWAQRLLATCTLSALIGLGATLHPQIARAGLDTAPAANAPNTAAGASSTTAGEGAPVAASSSAQSWASQASTAGATANDPAVLANRRLPKGRNVLRCWQEGKLIFEAAGVQPPAARSAEVLDFRPTGNDGAAVQILDLKQGLCTYEAQRP